MVTVDKSPAIVLQEIHWTTWEEWFIEVQHSSEWQDIPSECSYSQQLHNILLLKAEGAKRGSIWSHIVTFLIDAMPWESACELFKQKSMRNKLLALWLPHLMRWHTCAAFQSQARQLLLEHAWNAGLLSLYQPLLAIRGATLLSWWLFNDCSSKAPCLEKILCKPGVVRHIVQDCDVDSFPICIKRPRLLRTRNWSILCEVCRIWWNETLEPYLLPVPLPYVLYEIIRDYILPFS